MHTGSPRFQLAHHPHAATSFSRRHAHNYFVMGRRRAEDGAVEDARRLYARALQFNPDLTPALVAMANLELSLHNLALARDYAQRAAQNAPTDPDTLCLLGNIALSEQDATAALQAFTQARAHGGDGLELDFNTGLAHLILGHGAEAEQIFLSLLEAHPTHQRAWDALGCARRLLKNYQGATNAFLQALQIDPHLNDARDHLAQLLLETGNTRRACQVLESALALEPHRGSSRHLLGMAYAAEKDLPRAAACWEALIAQGDAAAETYHLLANAYLQQRDRRQACTALDRLTTAHPGYVPGHLQFGLLLLELGEQERGLRHLEQARDLDPQNPTILHALSSAEFLATKTKS